MARPGIFIGGSGPGGLRDESPSVGYRGEAAVWGTGSETVWEHCLQILTAEIIKIRNCWITRHPIGCIVLAGLFVCFVIACKITAYVGDSKLILILIFYLILDQSVSRWGAKRRVSSQARPPSRQNYGLTRNSAVGKILLYSSLFTITVARKDNNNNKITIYGIIEQLN